MTDAAVAATCTATGLTEGKHCSVCSTVIVAQTVTDIVDHTYVEGTCSVCGAKDPAAVTSESKAIAASAGTLSSDSLSITWTADNFTVVGEKASSTTAIRTSDSDHYRVYAKSTVTVSSERAMTKVVFTATSSYVTALKDSLTSAGYTVTVSGLVVTVELAEAATSITFTAGAQTRISNVEVHF